MNQRTAKVLSTAELRETKPSRAAFQSTQRLPISLVLDGIHRSYNLGAIIRLCDAMLIERLIVCGVNLELHKRKLVQAAQGAQKWVPLDNPPSAAEAVRRLKDKGYQIVVAELTSSSISPESLLARPPVCLIVGNERSGVAQEIVDLADAIVAIPMYGMCNSLNVATATSIVLYHLTRQLRG